MRIQIWLINSMLLLFSCSKEATNEQPNIIFCSAYDQVSLTSYSEP
jgi:hypothetical protein